MAYPRATSVVVRSNCCCASVTWVVCCATLAFASSRLCWACWTCASDFRSDASRSLRVHARKHLRRFDHVAFVGEHFGDAPRELGVDIDLVRLDPAVAECDAGRQLRLRLSPNVESAAGQAGHDGQGEREPRPTSAGRPSASRPAKGRASALAQAPWIASQSTGRPAPRSALRRGQCDWRLRPSRRPGWSAAMTISDSHVIAQKIVARMRLNSSCGA